MHVKELMITFYFHTYYNVASTTIAIIANQYVMLQYIITTYICSHHSPTMHIHIMCTYMHNRSLNIVLRRYIYIFTYVLGPSYCDINMYVSKNKWPCNDERSDYYHLHKSVD